MSLDGDHAWVTRRRLLALAQSSPELAAEASFDPRPGLADPHATSWQSVVDRHAYLQYRDGVARVGPADDRASTTFRLT